MDRCFQLILEQVHRYQGTVNQFLGDGVMALFGAPVALEEAPRCAVIAALRIQEALEELRHELRSARGIDFRMRIGIHSGLVVVGSIGDDLRMDYTAVGDTTNLASRLQEAARPGSILISEATSKLLRGFFELRDLGPIEVKGKSEPLRVLEVLAERPVSGRVEAVAETGLTPLVGRERELDALRAAFDSVREGHGQVVFLVGEAGIGKSRLLHEFRQRVDEERHGWVEGRCASYQRNTPFLPIIDGMRRSFEIEDRDDDASALAKIDRGVRDLGTGLEWTLPFLRQLLSLPAGDPSVAEMDAVTRRSETFRALQTLFVKAAEHQPLVLVIEDLHWIDTASEEFLGFLADSIPATQTLLLFTHRPGYQHPFGDRSYHLRLTIQALSAREMAAMAGSLLDAAALPEELRRLIAGKAEGNPFFIEEVMKSLLEEGVLRLENGGVEVVRDVKDISVPDSIQDVLMARLDRLAEEPKRAIQVASVIGREFAVQLLERISESGDQVPTVVGELRALELITQMAAHPELAFMFKHALTHEVAYESILLKRRRALHRVVATAIEDLYGDRLAEHYEALAHHFSLGEDWERAFRYHECASRKALDAYANHSAAEHCRQALAIADRLGDGVSDDQRRQLDECLGQACYCVSSFGASGEAYVDAADHSDDPALRARNLGRASYSFLWGHDYDPTDRTAAQALALVRAHPCEAAEAIALVTQDTKAQWVDGKTSDDGPLAEEALRLAERSADPEALVFAVNRQAHRAEMRGEFRSAIPLCERAISIARRERLAHLAMSPQWFLGLSLCGLGEYGRAIGVFREGLDLCERIGDRAVKTRLLNTLGWCFAEFGSHARASEYNEQAKALAGEMVSLELVPGAPELYANASANLAGNRVALGDLDGALEQLEPIRADLDRDGDPWMRWRYSLHVLDGLARVDVARGAPERALELIEQELEGARSSRSQKLEARALELRGRAWVTMDSRDEAEEALRGALQVARQIEYPPVVWRSLSLLAELARRSGRTSQGDRDATEARRLVEHLSRSLPGAELQQEFGGLGERLVTDPVGALGSRIPGGVSAHPRLLQRAVTPRTKKQIDAGPRLVARWGLRGAASGARGTRVEIGTEGTGGQVPPSRLRAGKEHRVRG
jgi:tetratricopeptide (TPR) repeat protein